MMQVIDAQYWKSIADLPDGFERINRAFGAIMAERDEAKGLASAAARGHSAQLSASRALKERVDELIAANNREIEDKREARRHVKTLTRALANSEGNDPGALLAFARALDYLGWTGPSGPAIPGNEEGEK
jgi:hypothetical protein